jgi:hypothetical protein
MNLLGIGALGQDQHLISVRGKASNQKSLILRTLSVGPWSLMVQRGPLFSQPFDSTPLYPSFFTCLLLPAHMDLSLEPSELLYEAVSHV